MGDEKVRTRDAVKMFLDKVAQAVGSRFPETLLVQGQDAQGKGGGIPFQVLPSSSRQITASILPSDTCTCKLTFTSKYKYSTKVLELILYLIGLSIIPI